MTQFISYVQRTGNLRYPPDHKLECYSGHGIGLNDPTKEGVHDIGPCPAGWWKITRWDATHGEKGPIVAVLAPVGHDAHGRSDFLIHGDNAAANHSASHGCIIMAGAPNRTMLRQSGLVWLLVVHEEADLAGDHQPPVDSAPLVA